MKLFVLVLSAVAVVHSGPVNQDETVVRSLVGNFVNCANSDLSLCFKENALKATERLSSVRRLKIYDGITLLNNDPKEGRSLEALSSEPDVRNKQLTERLWQSTSDLLQTGELELSYSGVEEEEEEESRGINDVEEGRGKKKKLKKKMKMLIPLVLLAKAKAMAIIVLTLIVIAASLFKLALIAKLAFIIKLIAIIKALLAKKHGHEETWEVAHGWEPHAEHGHVEHGHGWESGWSRSRNEGNNMAYSAYAN